MRTHTYIQQYQTALHLLMTIRQLLTIRTSPHRTRRGVTSASCTRRRSQTDTGTLTDGSCITHLCQYYIIHLNIIAYLGKYVKGLTIIFGRIFSVIIRNERVHTDLLTSDFYYDLPEELIAQHPAEVRDMSRLMVLDRENKTIDHKIFRDITEYLHEGDVLVINDSKVIPARLYGHVEGREDASIELLLLRHTELDSWETLVKPGKRAKIGSRLVFGDGILKGEITDIVEEGNRIIRFEYDRSEGENIYAILHKIGLMPLPPYITERLEDKSRYQTVYANREGSAAAPTAGLHFTEELLAKIQAKGIKIARVMLHVGLGTFRPVKVDNINDHVMHTEFFSVSEESADIINSARAAGGRIICVGTTSCRTLESAADENGQVRAISGDTGIFIYPGYKFKAVDALITNFHLPESTLLMLVSAFYDKENVMKAYKTAVEERYRFFSFGDAMLIR